MLGPRNEEIRQEEENVGVNDRYLVGESLVRMLTEVSVFIWRVSGSANAGKVGWDWVTMGHSCQVKKQRVDTGLSLYFDFW